MSLRPLPILSTVHAHSLNEGSHFEFSLLQCAHAQFINSILFSAHKAATSVVTVYWARNKLLPYISQSCLPFCEILYCGIHKPSQVTEVCSKSLNNWRYVPVHSGLVSSKNDLLHRSVAWTKVMMAKSLDQSILCLCVCIPEYLKSSIYS